MPQIPFQLSPTKTKTKDKTWNYFSVGLVSEQSQYHPRECSHQLSALAQLEVGPQNIKS